MKRIPFACKYYNRDILEKATLKRHRKMGLYSCYDYDKYRLLKIYHVREIDGNKVVRAVVTKMATREAT